MLFFQTLKGVIIVTSICVSLPYMLLRLKLVSVRLQTRLEFLPAVEVFYQYYMVDPNKNMKMALKYCLEENRILYPIKPVFEQLYRNLMTQRDTEESLRIFSLTLGHTWADYFVGDHACCFDGREFCRRKLKGFDRRYAESAAI